MTNPYSNKQSSDLESSEGTLSANYIFTVKTVMLIKGCYIYVQGILLSIYLLQNNSLVNKCNKFVQLGPTSPLPQLLIQTSSIIEVF